MPRPAANDLNHAVRAIVADQIAETLAPYQSALAAMATLTGGVVRLGPGRPKGYSPKRAKGGRTAKTQGGGDASKFSNGQTVRYKQGRGEFEAKIVKIDATANRVTVERAKDGKKVVRPADKVYAA